MPTPFDPYLRVFGYRLRRRRLELGFSQKDLAQRIGMSATGLSTLEQGKQRSVPLRRLFMLVTILAVNTDYLLQRTEQREFNSLGPQRVPDA